jgi:GYF domain 2/Domain of unknown function (DUF4190)
VPDDQWHYARAGEQIGPIAKAEMLARLSRGEIQSSDLVWTEGMSQWQPAGETRALFSKSAPPPLPRADEAIPYAGRATLASMYPPPADLGKSAGMRMLMPVGRSGLAIAAGYLGLFSFVIIPAPIALIISIMAIRDIKKHPETHGMGRAVFGLIMGILGSLAILVLVVAGIAKAF